MKLYQKESTQYIGCKPTADVVSAAQSESFSITLQPHNLLLVQTSDKGWLKENTVIVSEPEVTSKASSILICFRFQTLGTLILLPQLESTFGEASCINKGLTQLFKCHLKEAIEVLWEISCFFVFKHL